MQNRVKRGFTLIELLVVIAIIAILAAILFPVFSKARERAFQSTCTANQKQLALATMLFTQEKEYLPTVNAKIFNTLGLSGKVLSCPSAQKDSQSYAYNALLSTQSLGRFQHPETIWLTADASQIMIDPVATNADDLSTRHAGGIVASYLDGHVSYMSDKRKLIRYEGGQANVKVSLTNFVNNSVAATFTPSAANKKASITLRPTFLPTWQTARTAAPVRAAIDNLAFGSSYGLRLKNLAVTNGNVFSGDVEITVSYQFWTGENILLETVGSKYNKTVEITTTAAKNIDIYPLYTIEDVDILKEKTELFYSASADAAKRGVVKLVPIVTLTYTPTNVNQTLRCSGIDYIVYGDESYGEEE